MANDHLEVMKAGYLAFIEIHIAATRRTNNTASVNAMQSIKDYVAKFPAEVIRDRGKKDSTDVAKT